MNLRLALVPMSALWFALLGCSTPEPITAPPLMTFSITQVAPPTPAANLRPAQPCYIGTKYCRDLDSAPFAPCLLSSGHCPRDGKFIPLESDTMASGMQLEPYVIEPPKR